VAGTEGSVVLDVLISKEGVPEHISIQKGPLAFQKSALNAVRQWRWQSFLLNGNPIEVETSVTVVFTLKK
jgi:periplasmic protein TonB